VGDVGSRVNDVVKLGDCDTIVKELCEELGWIEELNRLWDATADTVDKNKAKRTAERDEEAKKADDRDSQDAVVAAQVEAISRAVQERLRIVDEHTDHALTEIARDIEDEPYEEYDDYCLESDSDGERACSCIDLVSTNNKNAGISSKGQNVSEAKPFGAKLEQSANPLNPQNVPASSVDDTGKDENNVAKTNL